jgi:hypothetical protein
VLASDFSDSPLILAANVLEHLVYEVVCPLPQAAVSNDGVEVEDERRDEGSDESAGKGHWLHGRSPK